MNGLFDTPATPAPEATPAPPVATETPAAPKRRGRPRIIKAGTTADKPAAEPSGEFVPTEWPQVDPADIIAAVEIAEKVWRAFRLLTCLFRAAVTIGLKTEPQAAATAPGAEPKAIEPPALETVAAPKLTDDDCKTIVVPPFVASPAAAAVSAINTAAATKPPEDPTPAVSPELAAIIVEIHAACQKVGMTKSKLLSAMLQRSPTWTALEVLSVTDATSILDRLKSLKPAT